MGYLGSLIIAGFVAGLVAGLVARAFTRPPTRRTETWGPSMLEGFLRVGRLTLDEWLAMDDQTRAAIAHVARVMEKDRIVALASASHSEDAMAALSVDLDDGEGAEDLIMGRTLGMIARRERLKAAQGGGSP